jgi:polyisoprenoid-binding protein YceI
MARAYPSWLSGVAVASLVMVSSLVGVATADDHEKGDSQGEAGVFSIDPVHSSVSFKVRHLVSNVPGNFRKFSGTIAVDPENLAGTKIIAEIDAASIDTANDDRDGHLKSADFFDVEKFPTISFESTKVKVIDKSHIEVTGNLTLHGVTKPVIFEAELLGVAPGMKGGQVMGAEATGTLDRKDFGIVWNRTLDTGGVVLGDDVQMTFQIEANLPEQKAPAK